MAISAELGEALEKAVTELVETGRYNSKSEVLREGVRLVQEREARFKELDTKVRLAIEQAESGKLLSDDEVFGELSRRYADDAA
ncbi:type II toxin-antitoxin system ParD family antitoxin [Devosia sp.]|uniref:type II toxin-antitoxin system ParD family antitoxin n=1 Tax=Devosia sp. TaxID=1871048 RepID=UPI0032672F23